MRAANAIKALRAEDNRVPKMKFVFTRTSSCFTEDNQILSPLESRLNPTFKLNNLKPSTEQIHNDGIKTLPTQTKQLATVLGLNSAYIFTKLRAKEIANEIEVAVNTKTTVDTEAQTTPYICDACDERGRRQFMNRGTQASRAETVAMAIQTDVEEFREPLGNMMARLSSIQLKAVRDFASLLLVPEPQNQGEMAKLRDDVLDIYYSIWGNGRMDDYSDRGRQRGDMEHRFAGNNPYGFNMNHFQGPSGSSGGNPRQHLDFDSRGGGPMNNDYGNNFGAPMFDGDRGMGNDYLDEQRLMEEEHLRHQQIIEQEEMERQQLLLLTEEAERREQDLRYEQDLQDFNRDSPDDMGVGRMGGNRFGGNNNNNNNNGNNGQWQRGDGVRRSRGAWKNRGRGRGR